jgi:hypothetical protein
MTKNIKHNISHAKYFRQHIHVQYCRVNLRQKVNLCKDGGGGGL